MIDETRYKKLNSKEIGNGPIVYWMNREIRTKNNWSLLFAQELAEKQKQPLLVVYNLVPGFLGGGNRQLTFKIGGLQKVEEELKKKDIPFFIISDKEGSESGKKIVAFAKKHKAGAVVTDFYPLSLPRSWSDHVRKHVECAFFGVDAHNIVPAWVASDKKEFAAHTFRPKIYKHIEKYLTEFPTLKKQKTPFTGTVEKINWDTLLPKKLIEKLDWIKPGEDEAQKMLKDFISKRLPDYAEGRNNAVEDAQSQLSPYLHYGMISAQDIALNVTEWSGHKIINLLSESRNRAKIDGNKTLAKIDHAGAFLEELIVRRELSDNFCFHEPNYDNPKGFPEWAQETLEKHKKDKREHTYTLEEFEQGKTHDPLWNACQIQMVKHGKMHGYMRMYWAKKILEWTNNVDTAMRFAIELNDKYELDGRDPNGYVGIAWSLGGVHDRPWFERPIFGKIRYMAESGAQKKFDIKKYTETWTNKTTS